MVVNVQGDEPLIDPQLINAVAGRWTRAPKHAYNGSLPIDSLADLANPNVVKVVLDARGWRITSAGPIPFARDHGDTAWWQGAAKHRRTRAAAPGRVCAACATSAFTVTARRFFAPVSDLPPGSTGCH